jgi:hypothetical protein
LRRNWARAKKMMIKRAANPLRRQKIKMLAAGSPDG